MLSSFINSVDFLVVDIETTGLSADRGDRVCEIGAVKLCGGAIIDSFGSLVNPERPISSGAYAVNRISPEMVASAPTFPLIAQRLWQMMEGSIIVAYNAGFDCSFLRSEFALAGFPQLENPIVDALPLARQLLPGLGKYPQGNVAKVLGISFPLQHRALEDATVTSQLLMHFTSILKAYDCTNVGDLLRSDLASLLHDRRMSIIDLALLQRSNLWLKYLSPSDGAISDRVVSPRECVRDPSGRVDSTYLVGYCHAAQSERNFRIDRMLDLRVMPTSL